MEIDHVPSDADPMSMDWEQDLQEGMPGGNEERKLIIPFPGTYFAFRLKYNPILNSGRRVDQRMYVAYLEEIFGVPLPSRLQPFHICRIRMLHCELPLVDHEAFLRDDPIPVRPSIPTLFEHEALPVTPELPIPNCFHLAHMDTLVRIETAEESNALDASDASVLPISEMRRALAHIPEKEKESEGSIEDDTRSESHRSTASTSRSEMDYEVLPLISVVDAGHAGSDDGIIHRRRLSLHGLQHFDDPAYFFDDAADLEDFIDDLVVVVNTIQGLLDKFDPYTESLSGEAFAELKRLIESHPKHFPAIHSSLNTGGSLDGTITTILPLTTTLHEWQSGFNKLLWQSDLEALPGELARLSGILETAGIFIHNKLEKDEYISERVEESSSDDAGLAILSSLDTTRQASSTNMGSEERLVQGIISGGTPGADVLELRDDKAQAVLDALQDWLDKEPMNPMRGRVIYSMVKIVVSSQRLPTSLFFQDTDLYFYGQEPVAGDSSSDILRARYRDMEVSVKRLRIYSDQKDFYSNWILNFSREALIWRQLNHPNILPFLGIYRTNDTTTASTGMVSPWMPNGTLPNFMNSTRYNALRDANRLLHESASGLNYLHIQRVIHGDIKDTNILVDEDGHARLADFGLSVIMAPGEKEMSVVHRGTTRWKSPQLLADPSIRLRPTDDIWAFGCLCIAVYTRQVPYSHMTDLQVRPHVTNGGHPPMPTPEECPDIPFPETLWTLLMKCWDPSPENRPTMNEILAYFDPITQMEEA